MKLTIEGGIDESKSTLMDTIRDAGYTVKYTKKETVDFIDKESIITEFWDVCKDKDKTPNPKYPIAR